MFGKLPFYFGAGVLFVTGTNNHYAVLGVGCFLSGFGRDDFLKRLWEFKLKDCQAATGTNVMVRSKAAFDVRKTAETLQEQHGDGEGHRQLFTEDEISEDVVLGSRLHAAGYKGVFLAENVATGEVGSAQLPCTLASVGMFNACCLCCQRYHSFWFSSMRGTQRCESVVSSRFERTTAYHTVCASQFQASHCFEAQSSSSSERLQPWADILSDCVHLQTQLSVYSIYFSGVRSNDSNACVLQVPLEPRAMWRQRSRWFKGGHLFLLSPTSVFFEKHKHMSLYQKSLYWICLITNVMAIYAEPVMFAMPFLCLALDVCAYGMDKYLFWTHLPHTLVTQLAAFYATDWARVVDALKVRG